MRRRIHEVAHTSRQTSRAGKPPSQLEILTRPGLTVAEIARVGMAGSAPVNMPDGFRAVSSHPEPLSLGGMVSSCAADNGGTRGIATKTVSSNMPLQTSVTELFCLVAAERQDCISDAPSRRPCPSGGRPTSRRGNTASGALVMCFRVETNAAVNC